MKPPLGWERHSSSRQWKKKKIYKGIVARHSYPQEQNFPVLAQSVQAFTAVQRGCEVAKNQSIRILQLLALLND